MSMIELENLKEEFLSKFLKDATEEDVIKSKRKVLKEFQKQISSGDNFQKILSANMQGQGSGNLMGASSIQSTHNILSNSSFKSSKTIGNVGGGISVGMGNHDLSKEIQAENKQRFLLMAACEEMKKLLKDIVQPYIIVKSCITTFESSGQKDQQTFETILKHEFSNIEKKILNILNNYQEDLPIKIIDTLQELQAYYLEQQNIYINKNINDLERLKSIRYIQIQAPYIGYHLVDETKVTSLYEKAFIQIENLRVQRVGTEFVHHFQKYLAIYVMNKMLINADILSGIVVCIKDYKKKKSYFFIQYCDLKVEDIESSSSQDSQISVLLNKHGNKQSDQPQPTRNVDMNSFFKQISASFLSMSFESFIPNYGVCSETGKIYRHQFYTTNDDRTAHAGIKNPLYFFKESFMIEKKSSKDFEDCLSLSRCNMANFFEALTLLHEFQKTDFKFEFKKGRKLQSLFLSKEHIASFQQTVQEFSKTLIWLEESVFPVNGRVCLLQIMNQIQPLVNEFSNCIMSKNIQEHLGFMKKISIEDYLIKISSKKALKKYILQNKSFEDHRLKDETSTAGGNESNRAGITSLNQNPQNFQTAYQLGQQNIGVQQNLQGTADGNSLQQITSSGIQITFYLMDLNILNFHKKERKVILKYAAENLLYLPMIISLYHAFEVLKKFNKHWRSTQLWQDNYSFVFEEEDEVSTLQDINKKLAQQYFGQDKDQVNTINKQQQIGMAVIIPKNDYHNYINNSFASPMKKRNQNIHLGSHQIESISSNENLNNIQMNFAISERNLDQGMQNNQQIVKEQSKQKNSNFQKYESIFVEFLGLMFNMNMMSILLNQTFQNIKFFDEENPHHIYLMKNYFKFNQVRGDKGYKQCGTLLEQSIRLKKYFLACLLIDQGEGKNITKDLIFNYLSEVKEQPSQYKQNLSLKKKNSVQPTCDDSPINLQSKNNDSNQYDEQTFIKICKQRDEFDQKLQQLVIKHHAEWMNEFNWEKMWRQVFNPQNYIKQNEDSSDSSNLLVYTYEYGVRSLPYQIWAQIFDFKKMDPGLFNLIQKNRVKDQNLTPQNQIIEEHDSGDDYTTSAKKQKENQKDKNAFFSEHSKILLEKINSSIEVLRTDSNKQSPKFPSFQQSKKDSMEQKSSTSEGRQQEDLDQINLDDQNPQKDFIEEEEIQEQQNLNQQQNDSIIRKQSSELEEGNQSHISEKGNQKDANEKEDSQKQSRKSSQQSKNSKQNQFQNENNNQNEQDIHQEQINDDVKSEGDKQLSPLKEERELQIDKLEKQQSAENKPSKQLFMNFDDEEEKINQTVRLSPLALGSHASVAELLSEGQKLCGSLEMKRFSYNDEKNYFIQNYLQSLENSTIQVKQRKLVIVHSNNLDLLIEETPQYPGLPYAEDTFVRRFSSNIYPKRMLVRINDVDYTFTQIIHNCQSMQSHIKQGIPYSLEKQSLGERILLSMILNKQYNGLEDEILEVHPTSPPEYRLVNISQSQPFQQSIIKQNNINYIINVKNVLFCMDQMNESIDQTLYQKYRNLNTEKLLDEWLTDLYFSQQRIVSQRVVIINPRFIIKLSQNQQPEDIAAQQSEYMNQVILFQKKMIKQLYNRLNRLTKYLKKTHMDGNQNSIPKYQDIFEAVNPLLADMYKRVNSQKEISFISRFEQIQQNLSKLKSFVTCDIPSFYSNFTLKKFHNYESLAEVISNFKSIGPLSAKEIVKQLVKTTRKDNNPWEDLFQNVYKNTQIKTIMMNGPLETDWNDLFQAERFINQLACFLEKPVQESKYLLSNLIFDSCDCISWKTLKSIAHERITILSLRGCSKITDTDVVKISETMPMLTYLDLSKNPAILKFNQPITSKYSKSKPLQFPQLKSLILEENINMVICDVESSCIQNINLNSCTSLLYLITATPNLKRICLNKCLSLLEEHAILFIIDGTNCIVDEFSCNGAFKTTLSEMNKSIHSKNNTYKIQVLSIFGRLFSKIKTIQDIYPLVCVLNRRGLNKTQSKESSNFFVFQKKSTTASDSIAKSCRMSLFYLLLKNSNVRELKFMDICQEISKDAHISSLLETLCEKLQESSNSQNKSELVTDIDTIDLSEIKLNENNMKHLGEIIQLIKTTSSLGLNIYIQNSQEQQSKGIKHFCQVKKQYRIIIKFNQQNTIINYCYEYLNQACESIKNFMDFDFQKNIVSKCQGTQKNDINKIDLSNNRLGAEQIEEICKMIQGVSIDNKLNQLYLKNCRINNELLEKISQAIKKNKTLRLLDLSNNSFDHEGLKPFMQSLYDNTNLTSLVLDRNNLTGQGFASIKKGRFLRKLHLVECWLEEQEISYICQLLQQEEQLNYLDLSMNKVNIQSTLNLVSSIKKSNCLKELVIKKIFDEEESVQNASRMSEIIMNSNSLQTLDISSNSIGSDGLINIGRALAQNTALRVLIINDDHTFGLRGVANLAELIQTNNTLQMLDIQGIEQNQESKLEGFQAAWDIVKQKLNRNNLIRLSKASTKHTSSIPYQKKGNSSPTQKSLDQSSFYVGGEKLDSSRIKGLSDHYRLGLSIDGGGIRGIIPGCIIHYLCSQTKREIHEIFDVVGGTSIGGILALSLVCTLDGKTPVARGTELPAFFEENGTQIFNSSKYIALWNNLRDKSKYDPAGIESILRKYFQNCKLSDVIKGTNVIATAMKRENIQGKNMAKIFRSKEAMFSDDKNFYVRDIGRATSAAPTYFPSAEIKSIKGKKYSLIDGAVGQNNPSKLVLDDIKTEALNSGNEKNFFLLSISTGTPITTQQISQNAGLFNLIPIINSLGEGALAFLDKDIEKSADGQYLRINPGIPVKKHEAELDNTDPKIVDIYKQCAYIAAEKFLMQDLKYGPFNDQNLLDWLSENTAKKKDTYI